MSETKHTPLPWSTEIFQQGIEIMRGHESIANVAPYREAIDGGVVGDEELDAGKANAQFIVTSVNARPKVEELLKIIFYNAGQAYPDGSPAKPGLANLQPMDWDYVVLKAREVESALGGKAE